MTLGAAALLVSAAGLVLSRGGSAPECRRLGRRGVGHLDRTRARVGALSRCSPPAQRSASPAGALRRGRRGAMLATGTAALAAIAVHVSAGHAAAGASTRVSIAFQWTHFAAAGIWIGGLAALLLGRPWRAVRGKGRRRAPLLRRCRRRPRRRGRDGSRPRRRAARFVDGALVLGLRPRGRGQERAAARDRRVRRPEPAGQRASCRLGPGATSAYVARGARARRGRAGGRRRARNAVAARGGAPAAGTQRLGRRLRHDGARGPGARVGTARPEPLRRGSRRLRLARTESSRARSLRFRPLDDPGVLRRRSSSRGRPRHLRRDRARTSCSTAGGA